MTHGAEVGPRESHRAVIPANLVGRAGEPLCVGASSAGGAPGGAPLVELVREDGVIRAIDITCACGQRVRVRCTYE